MKSVAPVFRPTDDCNRRDGRCPVVLRQTVRYQAKNPQPGMLYTCVLIASIKIFCRRFHRQDNQLMFTRYRNQAGQHILGRTAPVGLLG